MTTLCIKHIGITVIIFLFGVVVTSQATTEQEMEALLRQKQPVEKLLKLVQLFQNKSQIKRALRFCEQILKDEPNNHDILQKAAYLNYRLGWLYAADREERKHHYFKFFDYARRAKRIKPKDYHTSLLLAGAKAKKVSYLSHGDQVRIARELARDLQALMAQKGDNPDTIYLLSWLNFEVGRVPNLKKILATVLFGGLPKEMSIEKGFSLLAKAMQLRPDYIMYQYDLGLYHLQTGNREKARVQFEKVLSMRPQSTEGSVYQYWGHGRLREVSDSVR